MTMEGTKTLIRKGRVIDPETGTDRTLDILVDGGRIADIAPHIASHDCRTIEASRLVVVPGLIDMHVHLREPGYEHKETIAAGSRAAAAGGFTTVCCMPNTDPVNDCRAVTEAIIAEAARSSPVNVLPIAAISRGSRGEELTDMAGLAEAGAVAFSDDGRPVLNSRLMKKALEKAAGLGRLVIDHCEEPKLAGDGVMNDGPAARRFGFSGIPASSETVMVARDIILAAETGKPVHIAHISAAGSVEAVREARKRGIPVSAEVTPHHLVLTDEALATRDPDLKMNPPLRSAADVEALIAALADGTIAALATDHAPHAREEKARGLERAPFGIVGLETAVPVILDRIVSRGLISLVRFAELTSLGPARLLGLANKGRLRIGADADLTMLNLAKEIVIDRDNFLSKGRNTPFHGWKVKGAVAMTMVAGNIVFPFEKDDNSSGE